MVIKQPKGYYFEEVEVYRDIAIYSYNEDGKFTFWYNKEDYVSLLDNVEEAKYWIDKSYENGVVDGN